jgi:hypothetical protein
MRNVLTTIILTIAVLIGFTTTTSASSNNFLNGYSVRVTIDDDATLATVFYDVDEDLTIFGQVGTSTTSVDNTPVVDAVETDYTLAGFGAILGLANLNEVAVDISAELNFLNLDKIDALVVEGEVRLTTSYTYDNLTVYAGPALNGVLGDLCRGSDNYRVVDDSLFYGFIGLEIELIENVSPSIEYQLGEDYEIVSFGIEVGF